MIVTHCQNNMRQLYTIFSLFLRISHKFNHQIHKEDQGIEINRCLFLLNQEIIVHKILK